MKRTPLAAIFVLSTILSTAAAPMTARASDPDLCTPAPRTGCRQSSDVTLSVRRGDGAAPDRIDWRWRQGDATSLIDYGDPTAATDYALCIYDGNTTLQSESEAPTPATNSLVVSIDAPAASFWSTSSQQGYRYGDAGGAGINGLTSIELIPGADGRAKVKAQGKGDALGLEALDGVDGSRVISQLQNGDGNCWGAAVTVELRNPPPFQVAGIESADVIDETKARQLLDELAALYNRKSGADGPLDMTLWSNALGATEIQNRVATTPASELDAQALTSALYVFGWYGGTLFQRDGFQRAPGPAGPTTPDPAAFAGAVDLFRDGTRVAQRGTDQEVFDFLTAPAGGGPAGTGTGVLAAVESFGYNTGYGFAVLEDLIGVFNPPADKLVCSGVTAYTPPGGPVHPKLPFFPANAPLFDCTFAPSFLEAGPSLRPFLDEYLDPANPYVPTLPPYLQPAALKAAQDGQEGFGSFVWKVVLAGVIKQDQAYRESLWDVDNAFLEVVEAAGLLGLGALARNDAELGRRAVLAGGSVLEGWLASYSFGLGAPSGPEPYHPSTDPRVLPLFDLGTTPIE